MRRRLTSGVDGQTSLNLLCQPSAMRRLGLCKSRAAKTADMKVHWP